MLKENFYRMTSNYIIRGDMNYWTKLSIEYANQRNYLDDLFSVYPTIPNGIRDIDNELWQKIEISYKSQNNKELVKNLLKLELFPVKDSYVAYLKRDKNSIDRNPNTIDRLSGIIYEMGIDKLYERATEPKETNRQIGPLFKRWLNKGSLGLKPVAHSVFTNNNNNAILDASDAEMKAYASESLGYKGDKGLDFVAGLMENMLLEKPSF